MFEIEHKKLGAKIVYWRRCKGMSQETLSEKATVCRSRLSEIEHGRGPCSIDTLLLICAALKITINDLFS